MSALLNKVIYKKGIATMSYFKPLLLASVVLSIAACNSDSLSFYQATGDEQGIYIDSQKPIVMFVDTETNEFPVFIGDFNKGAVYATKRTIDTLPNIKTKGAISGGLFGWLDDEDTELKIQIADNTATVSGVMNKGSIDYSLSKSSDSQSLQELASGWVEDTSYLNWQILESGMFMINTKSLGCVLTGTMVEKNGYYVSNDVYAQECKNSDFDGEYTHARLATFQQNQRQYLVGVFVKDDSVIWQNTSQELIN
jgi:hypothetical protein